MADKSQERALQSFKAFEAKINLKHFKIDNQKPKVLESYLSKVARVLGVNPKD